MSTVHHFASGSVEFDELYFIGEAKYGVHIDTRTVAEVTQAAVRHYHQPVGYISNRVNDYSRDYAVYAHMKKELPNLVCVAIVQPNTRQMAFTALEQRIVNQILPVQIFSDIDAAKCWTEEQVRAMRSPDTRLLTRHEASR